MSGAPDSAADAESLPLVAVGPSASDFASEIIVELPKDKLDKVLNDFQSINEVRKAETPRPRSCRTVPCYSCERADTFHP